jgi:hypothetical protein
MGKWLAATAVLPLIAAPAVHAQLDRLAAPEVERAARTRQLDFRLSRQDGDDRTASLISSMVVQHDVAAHAFVGVGLADMYGRKKKGEFRVGDPVVRTRNPAVTFVMKF